MQISHAQQNTTTKKTYEYGDATKAVIQDKHGFVVGFTNDYMDKMNSIQGNEIAPKGNNQPTTNPNNTIAIKYSSSNTVLNITSVTGFWDPSGLYYDIVGEVKNIGYEPMNFVKIVSTFYDKNNIIIGTDYTYTDPTTIAPNESAPFRLMIGSGDVSDFELVKTAKLVVSGR